MNTVAGSALDSLDEVARGAKTIETSIALIDDAGGTLEARLSQTANYDGLGITTRGGAIFRDGRQIQRSRDNSSFGAVMRDLGELARSLGRLDPASVKSRCTRSAVKGKPLKDLCRTAWYEAFGASPPSADELRASRSAKQGPADPSRQAKANATRRGRRELLDLLTGGPSGVKAWNERIDDAKALAPFRNARLAGLDLRSAMLVDMPGADFTGANLGDARLPQRNLKRATFRDADLAKAVLRHCDLREADLSGANLAGASLAQARLEGAVLTGARLDDADLDGIWFDSSTVWPEAFELPQGSEWAEEGPNPAELAAIDEERRQAGPVDLAAFMKRVETSVSKSPLSKAMKMLKKDRFELFVEVDGDGLTGVVKSQTDPDLVYACHLAASGGFGCCTQNLNRCGGLRGGLCKHLLVLIVGMAQAGSADADTLDLWVQRAKLHEPEIDPETLGAVLLRYKGAEAGELDWRPAETLPEDFYAF